MNMIEDECDISFLGEVHTWLEGGILLRENEQAFLRIGGTLYTQIQSVRQFVKDKYYVLFL